MKNTNFIKLILVSCLWNIAYASNLIKTDDMIDVLDYADKKKVPTYVHVAVKGLNVKDDCMNFSYLRGNYNLPITNEEVVHNINNLLNHQQIRNSFEFLLSNNNSVAIKAVLTAPFFSGSKPQGIGVIDAKEWFNQLHNTLAVREFRAINIMDGDDCNYGETPGYSITNFIQNLQIQYTNLTQVTLLDLSYNPINDRGMSKLIPLFDKLLNLEVLDISHNMKLSFLSLTNFKELVLRKKFMYLNITHSNVSSLECIKSFATYLQSFHITSNELAESMQKLIFLPEEWLSSFEEKKLIPLAYITAHKKYYIFNGSKPR